MDTFSWEPLVYIILYIEMSNRNNSVHSEFTGHFITTIVDNKFHSHGYVYKSLC